MGRILVNMGCIQGVWLALDNVLKVFLTDGNTSHILSDMIRMYLVIRPISQWYELHCCVIANACNCNFSPWKVCRIIIYTVKFIIQFTIHNPKLIHLTKTHDLQFNTFFLFLCKMPNNIRRFTATLDNIRALVENHNSITETEWLRRWWGTWLKLVGSPFSFERTG